MTHVKTTDAKNSEERFRRASMRCRSSGGRVEYGVGENELEKALMCSSVGVCVLGEEGWKGAGRKDREHTKQLRLLEEFS